MQPIYNNWFKKYYAKQLSGCWHWIGKSVTKEGYGRCNFRGHREGAHRASYIIFKNEIPRGLQVMHLCHNKLCVNPDHLSLGTNSDNVQSSIAAGRKVGRELYSKETIQRIRDLSIIGLSSRAIARGTGVSKSHVSNILRGEQRINH